MANILALLGMKSMVAASSVAVVATGAAIVYKDEIATLINPVNVTLEQPQSNQQPAALASKVEGETSVAKQQPAAVPTPKASEVTKVEVIRPTFDILRVEKDGSVLIAGNAAPNAKIDVLRADGSIVVSTAAGPKGDFVALPNDPLAPGDYVLSLRAVQGAADPVLSSQSSLVTVPDVGGEVLAMISEEGQPSRIVTKPENLKAEEPVKPAEETAAVEIVKPEPVEATKADPAMEAKPEPVEIAKVEPETQPVEVVEKELQSQAPESSVVEAVKQEVIAETAETVEAKVEQVEVAVNPAEPVEIKQPEVTINETQVAEPSAPPVPQVIVEAVEVENGQIYIAGAIPRGVPVRVYVDNVFIGLARGTSDNRFLVSKPFDLSEGEHSVRADVIDSSNGAVITRAEVPLIHELPAELKPEVEVAAATPAPQTDEPEKVQKPVEVAALDTADPVVPEAKPVATTPAVAEAAKPAETNAAKPVEKPAVQVTQNATTKVVEAKPVQVTAASAPRMPKVLKTGRAVIIKRGDNLWRISRKTYGRGIRYTTIYNANRNQITDPHRIFIGQIFKIPKKAEQEG